MEFTREALRDESVPDLVRIANLNFGLGVNDKYDKNDLINMIVQSGRRFKGQSGIRIVDQKDDSAVPPGHVKVRVQPGKYDRIPRPVIVGHNFKMAAIPVNRDVIIPLKYLTCLKDALSSVYFQEDSTDPNKPGDFVEQQEHAYQFSILEWGPKLADKVEDEEYDETDPDDSGGGGNPSGYEAQIAGAALVGAGVIG